ncbi:MAG TPA: hypothetical protein VJ880_00040 [Allomuricauda sp.]|nr:hypothetical protein [Allomuricauda sp.]
MDINIQNKKIELIQWLSTLNDESIIEKIMKLRENEKADWWEEISKKEEESIENGLKDAASGNIESHSNVRKLYDKWL